MSSIPVSSSPESMAAASPAAGGGAAGAPTPALLSAVEAIIYVAEEPVTAAQIAATLETSAEQAAAAIAALRARYEDDARGIEIKAAAGGFRMGTKPQHHEAVRKFIRDLKPAVRLSASALETLAVIAYRQPVTAPEIKEIRGVDPAGVLNTLLERKLITTSGRKEVVGKPILYRTTREFLLRFGLGGLQDLPTLKEFEEMARAGMEGLEFARDSAEPAASGETAPLESGVQSDR